MRPTEREIKRRQAQYVRQWERRTPAERAARRAFFRERDRYRLWIGVREPERKS